MFRVLGPLEVDVDGERLTLPGTRLPALLVALLLQPNTTVPAHRLVDLLWDEEPPADPANALHQVVRRLRAALGPLGSAVETRPPGYRLAVGRDSVDADAFERACRDARATGADDPAAALEQLEHALALWRGPAYGAFAETFARAPSQRLEELRVTALEERTALLHATGAASDALAAARELAETAPLRPRPVELLMRALSADGRAAEALDVYRRHREVLADELGLDPPAPLQALHQQILRDAVPPPRPAAGSERRAPMPARTLPWRAGPLRGRAADLELLTGCLAEQRLVTVAGPGGVGKTRLVLEAAHLLAGAGTDVWWVDLSTSPPDRLADTLGDVTGTDRAPGPDPVAALGAGMSALAGVLCLDNAETVLAELAPLVETLLAAVPRLTVLVTSRERLQAALEHVHLLAPLPVPAGSGRDNPAVQLFIERAPGMEPAAVSDDEIEIIVATCRRLDGLPLAIEIGAARAPTVGLRGFAVRLEQGLDLLKGGRRSAAARHRSVRAVVDWSHGLLTTEEACLFARLAVFPAAFTAERAEAVCAGGGLPSASIAPLLVRLCEQSLVQAREGRFWMLQTLRTYADERLDGDERQVVRARHAADTARRLAALSADLWTPREPEAAAALGDLVPDLHAAWGWAAGHDRPLAVALAGDVHDYAYFRQRPDLLAWGLTVAGWDVVHPRLPDALATAAAGAWAAGRLREAEELTERGIAAAGGPDAPAAARALDQHATLAMFAGRTEEAAARYRQAADLYRRAGEDISALTIELSVCQVLSYDGGEDEAAARVAELEDAVRRSGNLTALAWWHYVRGEAVLRADPGGALASYEASAELAAGADNRLLLMLARSAGSIVLGEDQLPAVAMAELGRLLDQWQDLGNEATAWWVLLSLAVHLTGTGHDRDAALLAGAVLAHRDQQPALVREQRRLDEAMAQVQNRLGRATMDTALAEGARLSIDEAREFARELIRVTTAPAS
ncbi:BTAD domain-containing putative transcriptional regulator [Geodermatophilus aquaeductus]|uniref:Predicted ATPase n=1 Tax=Geodermatophilus aquaeductus TaxID=1564161 RepID=A0A521FVA0_9ACTN|nr:BTAD domain-containing putative transcriptional regulator [Geodermatophilus aquaeductus]SMO99490.1 Predicted ATPase [Geodermatophilus aquaeductus]